MQVRSQIITGTFIPRPDLLSTSCRSKLIPIATLARTKSPRGYNTGLVWRMPSSTMAWYEMADSRRRRIACCAPPHSDSISLRFMQNSAGHGGPVSLGIEEGSPPFDHFYHGHVRRCSFARKAKPEPRPQLKVTQQSKRPCPTMTMTRTPVSSHQEGA
jgi:hypothetical protein